MFEFPANDAGLFRFVVLFGYRCGGYIKSQGDPNFQAEGFSGVVSFLFMDRRVCRLTPQSVLGGKKMFGFAYYRRIQRGRACMSQAGSDSGRGGVYDIYIQVTSVCLCALDREKVV